MLEGQASAAQRVAELEQAGIIRVNRTNAQAGTGAPPVVATPAVPQRTAAAKYWATARGSAILSAGRARQRGTPLAFEDVSDTERSSAAPRHPFSAGGLSVRDPDDIPGQTVYEEMNKAQRAAARERVRGELSSRGIGVASNASYANMLKQLRR
jgi:hypothetical protein